jgi:L,D-transpeptidase ErfK/SrfK
MLLALTFPLPENHSDITGEMKHAVVHPHEDIVDLGQKYQVGYYEFKEANPKIDPDNLYYGTTLTIPSRYILPDVPRNGIIINLAEMRLYYYPKNKNIVMTYPIGIGREGANTPVMKTKIISKKENPTWIPTEATRERSLKRGIKLPKIIPPGPENPLGKLAMRLGSPSYLIHGTNDPAGIGLRSTAGCIRLYPENIEELYPLIRIGTPVNIINEPYKLGWYNHNLYLEAHVPVHSKPNYNHRSQADLANLTETIKPFLKKYKVDVNWEKAIKVAKAKTGIPVIIGHAR